MHPNRENFGWSVIQGTIFRRFLGSSRRWTNQIESGFRDCFERGGAVVPRVSSFDFLADCEKETGVPGMAPSVRKTDEKRGTVAAPL